MLESLVLMTPVPLLSDVETRPADRVVLVVDDEILIRWSLGERLRQAGYAVVEAATGQEAMQALARGQVDAVVLDIRLPDADGMDLLGQIKARSCQLPVVMISAHGTREISQRAQTLGAYAFLHKPFNVEEIAAIVDKALTAG